MEALLEVKYFEDLYNEDEKNQNLLGQLTTGSHKRSISYGERGLSLGLKGALDASISNKSDSDDRDDKIKNILDLLEKSRQLSKNVMMSFKSWVLQADFVINNVVKIDEDTDLEDKLAEADQQKLKTLFDEITGSLKSNKNIKINLEVLHTYSYLYLAKIQYRFKSFTDAWTYTTLCIKNSHRFNLIKLKQQAEDMFDSISKQLQQNVDQNFIFAKSLPLNFKEDENFKDFDHGNIVPNKVLYYDL